MASNLFITSSSVSKSCYSLSRNKSALCFTGLVNRSPYLVQLSTMSSLRQRPRIDLLLSNDPQPRNVNKRSLFCLPSAAVVGQLCFSRQVCVESKKHLHFKQLFRTALSLPPLAMFRKFYGTVTGEMNEEEAIFDDVIHKYLHELQTQYERSSTDLSVESSMSLSVSSMSSMSPMSSMSSMSTRELEDILTLFRTHQRIQDDISQLKKIVTDSTTGSDVEFVQMANDEISQRHQDRLQVEADICDILVPDSVDDSSDIILEVTAGVGGQEAMLFTKEILSMYLGYAQFRGWAANFISHQEDLDLGGVRHATVSISGEDVYKSLKFEGGVHRIQRVPKTERSGRVHTSTITVAVLPQPSQIDVYVNPKDLRIETCRASGKGGQHVNTTDSAVRIVHIPTGTFAECQTERSQLKNKDSAMKMLCSRLYEREQEKSMKQFSASRKLQVGSASRNEKIRTYNVKDDRITDHRIRVNLNDVKGFLLGGASLDQLTRALRTESRRERFAEKLASFNKT